MAIASDFLQSLVPISQFNKGQAAKIFDRLRSEKELIVLKNNQPSAIILSPEEYTRLTEIEENYFLLLEANKRLDDNGNQHKSCIIFFIIFIIIYCSYFMFTGQYTVYVYVYIPSSFFTIESPLGGSLFLAL